MNSNPELREVARRLEYMDSTEFKIKQTYIDAGLHPPSDAEIDTKLVRRRFGS
jgi:hypothetical protein